jgi:hypothetical protein
MTCLVVLLSSSSVAGADCPVGDFPVQWASPPHTRTRGALLDAMQELTLTQAEAEELRVWKSGRAAENKDRSSLSCVDYVQENGLSLAPDADGEWNWHGVSWESSQFVRDCIAMYLVGRAKPARHDCLAGFEMSPTTASELPSTLGLIGSSVEERGMSMTKSLPVWAPDTKFSLQGPHETRRQTTRRCLRRGSLRHHCVRRLRRRWLPGSPAFHTGHLGGHLRGASHGGALAQDSFGDAVARLHDETRSSVNRDSATAG